MQRTGKLGIGIATAAAGTALSLGAVPAQAASTVPNAVYTQTNSATGNQVVRFARSSNGKLTETARYSTGGTGSPSHATGYPFTDSQGSIRMTHDGRFLLVTNNGSDQVTSFAVRPTGLKRLSIVSSGGHGPISVTVNDQGIVYVLNEASGASISALKLSSKGKLSPIAGSTLALAYPAGAPADIGFDTKGKTLVVGDRMSGPGPLPDFAETFKVAKNGHATGVKPPQPMTGQTPFGFAFTSTDILLMTDAANDQPAASALSSYRLSSSGKLSPIVTKATGQTSACWIAITADDHWAFTSNAIGESISSFKVSHTGGLTPVTPNAATAKVGAVSLDVALSHGDRYLYVNNVDASFISRDPSARSHITVFKVLSTGKLKRVGNFGANLPETQSGIAAW